MEPVLLYLPFLQQPVTLYGILSVVCIIAALVLSFLTAKRLNKKSHMAVFALLSLVLGAFIGRLFYSLVRSDFLFYDELGEYAGLLPFFNFAAGSLNMGGILLGILLAAVLSSKLTKEKTANLLDAAVLPVLCLYAGMRLIEPLSGQGFGELIEQPFLCFYPIATCNAWDEWMLSVCSIEAILAIAVLVVLLINRSKIQRTGSLYLYAMALFAPSQMFFELFRQDDVLYIFVFASISLLCLVTCMVLSQFALLHRAYKETLPKGTALREAGLMLLGVIVCVGGIFALDKTNLPDVMVYAVIILALVLMSFLFCRRIAMEDKRAA